MKNYLLGVSAFQNPDLLEKCLKSWPKFVHRVVFFDGKNWSNIFKDLIDIKNGFKEDYADFVFTFNNHMGVGGAWNAILNYAFEKNNFDATIICGSDIEFKEGYLESYIEEFEKNKLEFSTARGQGFNCFCMTKKCYETVGQFDLNFWPAYLEDNDFHRRVKLSGLKDGDIGDDKLIEHFGSATIRKENKYNTANGQTFPMNQQQFRKKWGGEHYDQNLWKTPYNNSNLTIKDWILDIEEYLLKKKIWDV